jgi:hypothetical protein
MGLMGPKLCQLVAKHIRVGSMRPMHRPTQEMKLFSTIVLTNRKHLHRDDTEGLLGLIFLGLIFSIGFINCISILAHPHCHMQVTMNALNVYVRFISTCIEIYLKLPKNKSCYLPIFQTDQTATYCLQYSILISYTVKIEIEVTLKSIQTYSI